MANSTVQVTEGSGKQVATYSLSEEAVTKEVQRVSVNNSSGTEIGTSSNPIRTDPTGSTTQPISHDALTELAAAINSSKVDVNIASSSVATGGTSSVDDADFTQSSTSGTPAMGVYESTPTSVTDNDMGIVGITQGRRLKTSATVDAALPAGTNNIGDVDVLSSALPTGASTAANQTTIIGHVDGIEGLLTTIDADTSTVAGAISGTEMQVDIVGPLPAGTAAIGKLAANDGVDIGDVTLNNTTIAVTQSGTWDEVGINDSGNVITTDGSGSAGTPAGGVLTVQGASSMTPVQVGDNSSSLTVDNGGTFVVQENGGALTSLQLIDDAIVADDAAFTPATTKVMMAGFEFDDTTPDSVNEGDGGAARMSANRNVYTTIRDAAGNERGVNVNSSNQMSVSVDNTVTVGSHAVTNAGTFVVQENGAALTSLQLIDDTVATDGSATPTKGILVAGQDGTNAQTISTNSNGHVNIADGSNSITVDNGGTFAVQVDGSALTSLQLIDDVVFTDDTSTHSTGSSKGALFMAAATPTDGSVDANDIGAVAMTTDRKLHVSVQDALPAGTNAIGKLTANSGVDIGDVDITSIAAGDNNIGNVDIVSGTVTTVTTLTGGGIAHDSADSGNPHKIGYKAFSPDGTTPGTAVAENDRTDAKADLDGRHLVNDEHPRWFSYHSDGSTALTDASVASDPGDGFQLVITDIQFSNGSTTAISLFLEEGSTKIWGPIYLEAVNGRGYVWKGKKHVTASTALTVTTSASVAHSVEVLGYIQAV